MSTPNADHEARLIVWANLRERVRRPDDAIRGVGRWVVDVLPWPPYLKSAYQYQPGLRAFRTRRAARQSALHWRSLVEQAEARRAAGWQRLHEQALASDPAYRAAAEALAEVRDFESHGDTDSDAYWAAKERLRDANRYLAARAHGAEQDHF